MSKLVESRSGILVKAEGLSKFFPLSSGVFGKVTAEVRAVNSVNMEIRKGKTLGLVGESGCGKSTIGKLLIRLLEPTEGRVWFDDYDLGRVKARDMLKLRKRMQIVFQDPYSSLNPRMTIGNMLEEPMAAHGMTNRKEREEKAKELLNIVGLKPFHMRRYPHEFSGGERQRISIARALTLDPEFIVCDEPISALDVSIQSQILNLLNRLKRELSLTYLFISHDLSVVRYIADRIVVMYLGRFVELTDKETLFKDPLHPYTQALLSAVPIPDPERRKQRIILKGDAPNPVDVPPGCPFHERCGYAEEVCRQQLPNWREIHPGHFVSCHIVKN